MLTTQAFNALLKTLEEPPEHVKFIFATTEPNKILPTIISRCQRFDLRPIPTETIAKHLQFIASEEGVKLDDPAAWSIAKGADGGMRDAQSMLDQLVAFCGEEITETNVLEIFGFTSRETVTALTTALVKKDSPAALELIHQQAESGKELSQLLGELISCLRALLVARLDPSAGNEGFPAELWQPLAEATQSIQTDRILCLIDILADTEGRMKWASNKRLHLEIGLIKAIQSLNDARISDVIKALAGAGPIETAAIPIPTPTAQETATTTAPVKDTVQAKIESPPWEEEPKKESPTPAPPVATPQPRENPAQQPVTTPEPDPTPATTSVPQASEKKMGFDDFINAAPDEPAAVIPQPGPMLTPETKAEPEPEKTEPKADDFYQDPLIQKALQVFEGTLKE
jgi:DNA polymerase-3 subunit gamma/tau